MFINFDSCGNGVSMRHLWHARRVTQETFFLTLTSLHMREGTADLAAAYPLRLAAVGFTVVHSEQYASRSGKRDAMLFFVARADSPLPASVPPENVGLLAWQRAPKNWKQVSAGYTLCCEKDGSLFFVGRVTGGSDKKAKVRFYDCEMRPAKHKKAALVEESRPSDLTVQRLRGHA